MDVFPFFMYDVEAWNRGLKMHFKKLFELVNQYIDLPKLFKALF